MRIKTQHIKLAFCSLLLFCGLSARAQINVTLTPTHGTCLSDCQITVTATGTTGAVTYSLINYPAAGQNTPPQSSNVFSGLAPGTYTVGVYDATTGGVPVTAQATLTTSYVNLQANAFTASTISPLPCGTGPTGVASVSFSGGSPPYRIRVTNHSSPYNFDEVTHNTPGRVFSGLPSGSYSFEVEDACGQWIQSVSNINVTQHTGISLHNNAITNLTLQRGSASTYENGTPGNCSTITVRLYYTDIQFRAASDPGVILYPYSYSMRYRLEYPAHSGNFVNSWTIMNTTQLSITINNYNRSQTNGDRYRIQVEHPCSTGVYVFSNEMNLPPESPFILTATNSGAIDYCNGNPIITVALQNTGNTVIRNYNCNGPYTFTLMQGATQIAQRTTTGTVSSTTFTAADGVAPGSGYYVIITGTGGFTQNTSTITVLPPTNFSSRLSLYSHSANTSLYGVAGMNYHNGDYSTARLHAFISTPIPSQSVTYSISATGATPPITRPPVTHGNGGAGFLWNDIPWGTYDVKANYGCDSVIISHTLVRTVDNIVNGTPIDGFDGEMSYTQSAVCGRYIINWRAYFYTAGSPNIPIPSPLPSQKEHLRIRMMVIDAPAGITTGTVGSLNSGYTNTTYTTANLPGGTYTYAFFPYHAETTSPQIINGRTYNNFPTDHSCVVFKTVVIPEYEPPRINVALSGGISCASGFTNMTVTVTGSKPPFTYRYKVKGAPDSSYPAFQSGNVFPNVAPGEYTVQITDSCGSITTQDVRVFDGSEQFVGIIGEVQPGVICETREILLSVLSIGPVSSYEWYHTTDTTGGGVWTQIGNTTYPGSPTYVISSASMSDVGFYKVIIDNGVCTLSSQVHIINVLPPAGTPVISGNNIICQGGSTTLTATTSIVNPHYQWYKDGVAISGANSNTYSVTSIGAYTVVVTPLQGCPSDPSNVITVTEQIVAAPGVPALSAASICGGQNPVIGINPSLAGLTYNVYTAATGGTLVGTGTGTGSLLSITLSTTPAANTTYYVGTALGSCVSSSRTAITITVSGVLVTPAITIIGN